MIFSSVADLLTTPPGFVSGVDFPAKSIDKITQSSASAKVLNLADLLSQAEEIDLGEEEETSKEVTLAEDKSSKDEPQVTSSRTCLVTLHLYLDIL